MTELIAALQRALAAEHAASYAYGIIGARLSGGKRAYARTAFTAHRLRRDRLRIAIGQRGATPVEASPTYQLPLPVTNAESVLRLAAWIEDRMVAAYLDLVAVTDPRVRSYAAAAMREYSIYAFQWRGSSVPFPGMPTSPSTGAGPSIADLPTLTTEPTPVPPLPIPAPSQ